VSREKKDLKRGTESLVKGTVSFRLSPAKNENAKPPAQKKGKKISWRGNTLKGEEEESKSNSVGHRVFGFKKKRSQEKTTCPEIT